MQPFHDRCVRTQILRVQSSVALSTELGVEKQMTVWQTYEQGNALLFSGQHCFRKKAEPFGQIG
jgi:hypothetical protein